MYQKQNFKNGTPVYADQLNRLEDAIVDLYSRVGSGGSGGMSLSGPLNGPGYTITDGMSLSVEIEEEV